MSQPSLPPASEPSPSGRWTGGAIARATLTALAIVSLETVVCGLSAVAPSALLLLLVERVEGSLLARAAIVGFAVVPAYVLFALCLMTLSAASTRVTGARTPTDTELRIADMSWPLLQWARYMASSHVVRVLAGPLFRGTPIWTLYLRMNGARFGRRVFVNSLFLSDHNLLTFGNDVVIGSEVHLSGHTVERGYLKTGRVSLGDHVTIGLGSVVDIDVVAGAGVQVGAQSLVPKHARLAAGQTYVGIPVRPAHPPAILGTK